MSGNDTALIIASITGGVTLVIAAATCWSAAAANKSAAATRVAAEATNRAADAAADETKATLDLVQLSRQQMTRSFMPIVRPDMDQLVTTPDVRAGGPHDTLVQIPMRNVGVGPALKIEPVMTWLDRNGDPSVASQPMEVRKDRTALGPNQERVISLTFRGLATPVLAYRVQLDFRSALGDAYRVVGRYVPEIGVYRELQFWILDADGRAVEMIEI